jgi:hypothetical protein
MKRYRKRLATVIADRRLPPQEHFDFCFLQRPVSRVAFPLKESPPSKLPQGPYVE